MENRDTQEALNLQKENKNSARNSKQSQNPSHLYITSLKSDRTAARNPSNGRYSKNSITTGQKNYRKFSKTIHSEEQFSKQFEQTPRDIRQNSSANPNNYLQAKNHGKNNI